MSQSVFNIATTDDPRKLTQSVIQVIDCLNMYQAELARVLGLQCNDIGELSSAKRCLQPGTEEWNRAILFVRMYQLLFAEFNGDGIAINHWMRSENNVFERTPHLLIVDDDKLEDVVGFLETPHDT